MTTLLGLCLLLGCATHDKFLIPCSVDRVPEPKDAVFIPRNQTRKLYPVLVFLHGRGSSATECAQSLSGLADTLQCIVFIPCASAKLGMRTDDRAAYEWDTSKPSQIIGRIDAFIQKSPHADRQHVYLAGISMGGNMAYLVGLENPQLFKGILCFSGYLNPFQKWSISRSKTVIAKTGLPIYAVHGLRDEVVPCKEGQNAIEFFTKKGFATKWQTFDGGHGLPPDFSEVVGNAIRWFDEIQTGTFDLSPKTVPD